MRKYSTQLQRGDTYGEWILLEYQPAQWKGRDRAKRARWLCRCSCGVERDLSAERIMDGQARLTCGHSRVRTSKELDSDMTKKAIERSNPLGIGAVSSVFQLGSKR